MRRALVIVNPIAGRGAGQRRLPDIEAGLRERGLETEVVVTSRAGDARQAVAARADACDLVAVIGGDGTLNEAINGLEADRPLALFPLGTGNVLAKELRLPRRVAAFCDAVAKGRERRLDLAAVGGRTFVSMVGAGLDAQVASELAARRGGAIRMADYVRPLARCLARSRSSRIAVSVDGGKPMEAEGFVLVSNVRSYGGPFVIAPQAAPDDGLLDVCALRHGGFFATLWSVLAFTLRCQRLSGARYTRGRSIHLTSSDTVPYQVDGDPAGHLPASIELLDRRLRFIIP